MTGHLLDEALKQGCHYRCPVDGAEFTQKVMTMTGRWAPYVGQWVHLNQEMNEYHIADVGEVGRDG